MAAVAQLCAVGQLLADHPYALFSLDSTQMTARWWTASASAVAQGFNELKWICLISLLFSDELGRGNECLSDFSKRRTNMEDLARTNYL